MLAIAELLAGATQCQSCQRIVFVTFNGLTESGNELHIRSLLALFHIHSLFNGVCRVFSAWDCTCHISIRHEKISTLQDSKQNVRKMADHQQSELTNITQNTFVFIRHGGAPRAFTTVRWRRNAVLSTTLVVVEDCWSQLRFTDINKVDCVEVSCSHARLTSALHVCDTEHHNTGCVIA